MSILLFGLRGPLPEAGREVGGSACRAIYPPMGLPFENLYVAGVTWMGQVLRLALLVTRLPVHKFTGSSFYLSARFSKL